MDTEQLFELRRRTFDTPHFRGIEFIEVESKSILNKVPGNYLPFNWTINPYRGCSHSCSYCTSGDTLVLMADGRTRQIKDLTVGEAIYGTEGRGTYRRYVKTEVLDHWSTTRRAYRISVDDGTELVASSGHRFLSDRGWKYVTGAEQGLLQRPSLTINNTLLGPGQTPNNPGISGTGSLEGSAVDDSPHRRVMSIEDLGMEIPMYDITTGTGDFIANGVVSHNCFARSTHTYLDMNAGRDFETKIVVKVNAPQLLRKELRAKRWMGESIAMGTATDPYQRAEGKYRLMEGIIQTLTDYRNPFSILTKGTLILRDLDLLLEASKVADVSAAFSIGTLDEEVWRSSEPGTPHPRKRIEAVAKLNAAGIPCGVLVAPILPGISDGIEQLREVVTAAVDAGATHVHPILLHLRPIVREVYMDWLKDSYPHLVTGYEAMYTRSYASKAERAALSQNVDGILRSLPRKIRTSDRRHRETGGSKAREERSKLQNEQLKLI